MQALGYYLAYPFVFLVGILPFPALYFISDCFAFIIRVSGYRKGVIQTNLRNSFPEKTEKEINALTRSYYHYMCDLTLETFKLIRMSEAETRKHIQVINPEVSRQLRDRNQSFIFALGHYGNWEWVGHAFQLFTVHTLVIIYHPLSNPYFDRMMQRLRIRYGMEVTTMQHSMRTMFANRDRLTATAFVGDQAAPTNAHWMTFLNQDSSVYNGIDKMSHKLNLPVVYCHLKRPRRGYYTVELEVIVEDPSKMKENEITEIYIRRLERDIRENPVMWLWSHRRWKSVRPPSMS